MNRVIGLPTQLVALGIALCIISSSKADKVVLVAGGGEEGDGASALKAKLAGPFAVGFDPSGNLYFPEMPSQRVRKVDAQGILTTIAGTGTKGSRGDDGLALKAEFNGVHNLIVTPDSSFFIADTWNNRVRKYDLITGKITAFAGTGEKGFGGDAGPALKAKFGGVYCLALDPEGKQMYLADLDNLRIRAIDLETRKVRTVAGNGKKGVPEDGAEAVNAPLVDPRAVAADAQGNIYILERSGHALRVVDRAGKIRTVVGTGKQGASGDGGDARKATLNGPKHLCIDRDGGVVIADTENHTIRKYLPAEGKIIRIAGTGTRGSGGVGGPPEKVELNQPHGVNVHGNGDLYIADSSNNRILKVVREK